jgi:hypothetical protein
MVIFTYRAGQENSQLFTKVGLDQPSFQVDMTDGMGSATLGAVTVGAVDSLNANATASVVSGVTTSGAICTIALLTAGTSGTQAAIDGSRFRVRTTVTLSNSRVLVHDAYLIIRNPIYDPD